ncbi:MAG TPA: site-specific integrase, partial [bacterium]|nr:site-specific integrase [bacterium]
MDKFIQGYLSFLETEKNASPHTVKNYRIDLREFAQALQKKMPGEVTYLEIRAFLAVLKEKDYSKSTISRKLACIRSFFKYLVRENILKTNPAAGIATPKRDKRLPQFLDPQEVTHLLEAPATGNWEGKRDRAILELFYSSGLRVSELVGLNHDDVDFFSELVRVRGKGKKERIVPVGSMALKAIQTYAEHRPPKEKDP